MKIVNLTEQRTEGVYMNKYQRVKENARNKAIEWQSNFNDNNYSYGELAYYQSYFEHLAKRYGLVREFKENAII